jgi:signal transduction histidine kinase
MNRRSLRFRLTIWYAGILSVGLALFGALLLFSMRHQLLGEIDRDLQGRATRFERYFKAESLEATHVRDELNEFCQALPQASYLQLRGDKGFAFRCPEGIADPAYEYRTLRRQFTSNGESFDLEAGAPLAEVDHTLGLLAILLCSLIPLVIAIACIGGAWLSGRALKPVHDITAAAHNISIENLSQRLPVPPSADEIARLTEVLNSMLAKLESAVKTLSQFVADASHELRTPLTVIRTTAELALRRTRNADSYRDALQEVAGETERMTQLVEDLLILARNDTSVAEMPLAPLDVRSLLQDVRTEVDGLAKSRRIEIQATLGEHPAMVAANRPALHRLFLVLVDNSLKYSRDGDRIGLSVETGDAEVRVSIHDSGAGISASDLPHIFKRFYRADRARTGGGHGLGLALAESIARAHGAVIQVDSTEGAGSVFRVVFPQRVTASANPQVVPVPSNR